MPDLISNKSLMRLFFSVMIACLCLIQILAASVTKNARRNDSNLKIGIDFQSARAVINLLGRSQVTEAELNEVAKLPGNQQLIKKVFEADSVHGEEVFKETLHQAIENQKIGEDPFDWQTVRQKLPEINLLISQIENNQSVLRIELENIIRPYTPNDLKIDVTAFFLVGGGSLGFTLDGDFNFYVGLHKTGGDYEALRYLIAHELYHSIQAIGARRRQLAAVSIKSPANILKSLMLVRNVYTEGTATLVGSPLEATNLKQFGQAQQEEYRKNLARSRQNFALFDALLFQAYNDPAADADQMYAIGFSTSFDETLYYVGYRMARDLAKYEGKQVIAPLINKNPLELFRLYIELYKSKNDPALIKFNKSTEDILMNLPSRE